MVIWIDVLKNFYMWVVVALGGFLLMGLFYLFRRKNHFQGTHKKDAIVVGLYAEYKPFEFVNELGEVTGFDVDFVREVARKMNKKVHIKNISFDSLIPALKQGEIDIVISGISITPDRLDHMEMIPYHGKTVRSFALIFWREVPTQIKTIYDFKDYLNRRVAVQVGTVQEEFLSKFDFIEPKPMCSMTALILDVRHGDSIAAIVKSDMAYSLQSEYPKIKIVEVQLDEKDWVLGDGIGVRKGNKVLADQLKNIVVHLKTNGVASRVHSKWLKDNCCEDEYRQ